VATRLSVALSEPREAGADSVFLFVLLFSVASRREISSSCHRSSAARILTLHHLSSSAYSATVHSIALARGGSSLMPSSRTDPEICARHNLGSSRPARRLPRCTLRRNLRSTAQPQKTKNTSCFKSAWSAALTSGAIGNGKPNFSAMTRSTLASIALYSGSPAFTGLGRSAK